MTIDNDSISVTITDKLNKKMYTLKLNTLQASYVRGMLINPCLSEPMDYKDDEVRAVYYTALAYALDDDELQDTIDNYKEKGGKNGQ